MDKNYAEYLVNDICDAISRYDENEADTKETVKHIIDICDNYACTLVQCNGDDVDKIDLIRQDVYYKAVKYINGER